ncbi:serine/threonine protein kinase [Nocardia tenerifensis]|uniref:non-specific serine/threonine protein kinase n=1 Tax=Nocardia tenerifensis TaxID=228006 RepID=A0A318KE11_9NOCA|nr:serine/threonine-protein kinase [Nocardia tenerifensis]PXX57634.1 serine/threonine protein kinase [Nocardia tenerifensis]
MDVTAADPQEPDGTNTRIWGTPTETAILPGGRVPSPAEERGQHSFGTPRLLGGRYRLLERLGQGGMGTVWKAHDTVISRDVAVKEPRLSESVPDRDRAAAFARLEREARAAAHIDHPSVVTIYDVVSEHGKPWIIMELINGQSLADVLVKGTLTPQEAARIALPVVEALAAAHACKVLHRDVKPANIMLEPGGRVVLTDFGIAHIDGEAPVTATGTLVGSADYTAPERILGRVPGPESDLFALGVLLYASVEGFSPFWRQTRHATFQAVLHADPSPPRQAGELCGLIMDLLAKEPDRRPSATQITAVLQRVAGSATVPNGDKPRSVGLFKTFARHWNWTHPAVTALSSAVVTAGVVVAAMGLGGFATNDVPGTSSGSPDVPAGWKMVHKLGASIAVPADYEAYDLLDGDGGVAFQMHRGQAHQELLLFRWDAPGSPEERAAFWYRQFMANAKLTDKQVTVSETHVNGRKSMVLTMTYRGDGGQLWRKRELYYNSDRQPWKLVVDWAVDSEMNTGGDELFDAAVRTFVPDK